MQPRRFAGALQSSPESIKSHEKLMREHAKHEAEHAKHEAQDVLDIVGLKNVSGFNGNPVPGSMIHKMGTARMGKSAKDSVVNKNNQLHDVPNVFVTDGSCMTSSAYQNPSLTYMALTARAADYAVNEMRRNNI